MKSSNLLRISMVLLLILSIPGELKCQRRWWPYLDAGYITNFKTSQDSERPDAGGSVRIGVLHKGLFGNGRVGVFTGITWFREYNIESVGYDDSGTAFVAGIDYLIFKIEDLHFYLKGGIGPEKYTSTYPTYKETEIRIKPDLGFFLNYKYLNAFIGLQPSDPMRINIGIGFTLYKSIRSEEPNSQ